MSIKPITAIAVFDNKKIKGTVYFSEDLKNNCVNIDINIVGLKKTGLHGFHVHEYGDMSEQCQSMCAHFNPYNKKHGGQTSLERHVGDLGNLITDKNGFAKYRITDSLIKLRGTKSNIIGRGLVIHEDEDDCGLGNMPDSLTTGNSGKRIACAVIGYAKQC
uniref:superoxide dismutase n=1 Tax=viral metagenome TaxID=1070528 RepID=A0A6C0DJU3_9ZZZZ